MNPPASETTVVAIENRIATLLAEKLSSPTTTIATNKYLTSNNTLVYLTVCTVAESSIPRQRVQIFTRVDGGVRERGFALFSDRTFTATDNQMIFGQEPPAADKPKPVDEPSAAELLTTLSELTPDMLKLG